MSNRIRERMEHQLVANASQPVLNELVLPPCDFLGRLSTVVLREYNESGYPITQDVLKVGDDGVTAIGAFNPKGE